MLGPGGTMSGMYYDDARGLRSDCSPDERSTARQVSDVVLVLQKEEQELEIDPVVFACRWLDAVQSVGSSVSVQTAQHKAAR